MSATDELAENALSPERCVEVFWVSGGLERFVTLNHVQAALRPARKRVALMPAQAALLHSTCCPLSGSLMPMSEPRQCALVQWVMTPEVLNSRKMAPSPCR